MMNENVYEYTKNLVLGKVDEYEKYTCFTHTNSNYNSNIVDVTCAFGNDNAVLNNYHLNISDALVCDIDTNSYSYNSSNHLERINCYKKNVNISIPNYEVIYSNMGDPFPNLLAKEEYVSTHDVSYNLDTNSFYVIHLFLAIFLLLYFLSKIFRVR